VIPLIDPHDLRVRFNSWSETASWPPYVSSLECSLYYRIDSKGAESNTFVTLDEASLVRDWIETLYMYKHSTHSQVINAGRNDKVSRISHLPDKECNSMV
jgi:hypothetical protein